MDFNSIFFHIFDIMVHRIATLRLAELASTFKAVAVTGPRQTGKTTLVRTQFPDKPYVSLENPDTRRFALEDPRGFLNTYSKGAILDEVQRTPEIFSYLQEILDRTPEPGSFILTGSNHFLLQQNISQSLAGRVAYLNLLPFSVEELNGAGWLPASDEEHMWKGGYPPIYDQRIPPQDWCANYVRTYVERDVRQIRNISDLLVFDRFLRLVAGRSGQELNLTSLSVEAGVDVKTAQSWIGVLEGSFIIHLLPPYFHNFNKTIVKRPKLYMLDTALLCHLIGVSDIGQLQTHPLRGAIFETMVVSELVKWRTHRGLAPQLYYWRDKTGHEIDIIAQHHGSPVPMEIKAGQTITSDYFKNLRYWMHRSGAAKGWVLYAGDSRQQRSDGVGVLPWKEGLDTLY